MATVDQFKNKSIYSFSTYNTSYLGVFDSVSVIGKVSLEVAMLQEDVVVKHMNVLPSLPDGVDSDPNNIDYLLVKDVNGATRAVGLPWIITNTVVEIQRNKIEAIFEDMGPSDLEKISDCLIARGYGGRFTLKLT